LSDDPSGAPGGFGPRVEDHGVICELVLFGPQVGGLLSGAFGPSSKSSVKSSNGTCGSPPSGRLSKVVLSCPVSGLALTLPINRAEIP